MKLSCIGDISVDWYCNQAQRFVGGISFNVAWHAQRLGFDSTLYSAVGVDSEGRSIVSALQKGALKNFDIASLNGETATQRILLDASGERKFDGYRIGVLSQFRLSSQQAQQIAAADIIHIPLSDGLESIFSAVIEIQTSAAKVADFSMDYSAAQDLPALMQQFAPRLNLAFLGGAQEHIPFVQSLAQRNPKMCLVLTLGAEGVRVYRGADSFEFAAPKLERVVDTTGCGDAFQAGFLKAYLEGAALESAVDLGCAGAREVAQHLGATNCILSEAT